MEFALRSVVASIARRTGLSTPRTRLELAIRDIISEDSVETTSPSRPFVVKEMVVELPSKKIDVNSAAAVRRITTEDPLNGTQDVLVFAEVRNFRVGESHGVPNPRDAEVRPAECLKKIFDVTRAMLARNVVRSGVRDGAEYEATRFTMGSSFEAVSHVSMFFARPDGGFVVELSRSHRLWHISENDKGEIPRLIADIGRSRQIALPPVDDGSYILTSSSITYDSRGKLQEFRPTNPIRCARVIVISSTRLNTPTPDIDTSANPPSSMPLLPQIIIFLLGLNLIWLSFVRPVYAAGRTINVCPPGYIVPPVSCHHIGSAGLQMAVNQANSGDKIVIYGDSSSPYTNANITIGLNGRPSKNNIQIIGKNKGVTLDASGAYGVILVGGTSRGITFSNLILKNASVATVWVGNTASIKIVNSSMQLVPSGASLVARNNAVVDLVGNTLSGNGVGVSAMESARIKLINNNIFDNAGNGVSLNNSSMATLVANRIYSNSGIGIYVSGNSALIAKNNSVYNNAQGGTFILSTLPSSLLNNLFFANEAFGVRVGINSNLINLANNIFAKNTPDANGDLGYGLAVYGPTPATNYNLFWSNTNGCSNVIDVCNSVGTILESDPLFADIDSFNFHLLTNSPAIDAGSPTILDPDNTRSDMGVYGGPSACLTDPVLFSCTNR